MCNNNTIDFIYVLRYYYYMKKEYLERLKEEYIRKKMFANGVNDEDKLELGSLRTKIIILQSSLQP